MTARQRSNVDGGVAIATPPAPTSNGHPRPLLDYSLPPVSSWPAWFRDASEAQRNSLLELAQRQGIIYAHQVPPAANGVAHKLDPAPQVDQFKRWLGGCLEHLPPVTTQVLTLADQDLDLAQREAVHRAVFSPDLCLIQGLPGTGKSRVVSEILHQCAVRGERVLFVSRREAALDAALARLRERPAIFAVRHLGPQESMDSVPVALRPWTLAQRRQDLHGESMRQAVTLRAETEARCLRRRQQEPVWKQLEDLHQRWRQVQETRQELQQRLANFPEPWAPPPGKNGATVETATPRPPENSASLDQEIALLKNDLDSLRPLAQAKNGGRWWSLTWWKATLQGDVVGQEKKVQEKLVELEALRQSREAAQAQLRDQQLADHQRLIEAKESWNRERQNLTSQQEQFAQTEDVLKQDLRALNDHLDPEHRLEDLREGPLAEKKTDWQHSCRRDDEACKWVRQWQTFLEEVGPALAERLLDHANVQAIPLAAVPQFSPWICKEPGRFDLVLIEEAEGMTEADIYPLLAYSRRWVLMAEGPLAPAEEPPTHLFPGALRANFFQRLWRAFHGPEATLSCSWKHEGDRLVCCLLPIKAEDAKYLESERLADTPEIELRILARPDVPPALAQVLFPPTTTVVQAKAFIFHEMQERTVAPASRAGWFRQDQGNCHFQFSPRLHPEAQAVPLDDGVREWVTPRGETCSLEFTGDNQRGRAEAWVQTYLGRRDLGRCLSLETNYRMKEGLARPIQDILFPDARPGSTGITAPNHELEFVSVPPPKKEEPRRGDKLTKPQGGPGPWPKDGAGLEQDLSATRLAGRLPADLQAELPRVGLVNFLEAQAVIRKLEELAKSQALRPDQVFVLALYEAQTDLLRRLAARSEILKAATPFYHIGLPSSFVHQEADIVLVSLTRSHVTRAVPFGADPKEFVLALTRARERLILFGDPGTLVKRSLWQGPLDQFAASAANLEGQRLARLVHHLSGLAVSL